MIHLANSQDEIILDFFSGSATTAHAVMQLNAEDGGKRKFIMVQIPEATEESSEAFKAGYKNICEIGKERIRRAGKKVKEEAGLNGQNLDIGFRVLKLDSSNMKNVYYSPEEYVNDPGLFDQVHDNIKEDRSGEDLLFQIMLDLGIELSADIKTETIGRKKIYTVKDNYLIACFDADITDDNLTEIAKRKPFYAVLRDSSFTRDDTASNFEQIFATWSPETIKKVL
jgi:adenine-specific DNA-methyltransferase